MIIETDMKNKNITETYGESVKRLQKKHQGIVKNICETYEQSAKRLEKTSKVN